MQQSHENKGERRQGVTVAIVAPDVAGRHDQHAAQFAAAKIPFIFDPGQGPADVRQGGP
jgi:adenosine kinase